MSLPQKTLPGSPKPVDGPNTPGGPPPAKKPTPPADTPAAALAHLKDHRTREAYTRARKALFAAPAADRAKYQATVARYLPVGLPPTFAWPLADRFDLYALYVYVYGSADAYETLAAGNKVILGLRVTTGSKANGKAGEYDDMFVVLDYEPKTDAGQAWQYVGNTDPSAQYDAKIGWKKKKKLGQDVDGDGVKDLGRIPAGSYQFHKGHSDTLGNVLVPSAKIRLDRDSNHDGKFDDQDTVKKGLEKNLYAGDTLFHRGGKTNTWSAGCQTMDKPVFNLFWKRLAIKKARVWYVLVTVTA